MGRILSIASVVMLSAAIIITIMALANKTIRTGTIIVCEKRANQEVVISGGLVFRAATGDIYNTLQVKKAFDITYTDYGLDGGLRRDLITAATPSDKTRPCP